MIKSYLPWTTQAPRPVWNQTFYEGHLNITLLSERQSEPLAATVQLVLSASGCPLQDDVKEACWVCVTPQTGYSYPICRQWAGWSIQNSWFTGRQVCLTHIKAVLVPEVDMQDLGMGGPSGSCSLWNIRTEQALASTCIVLFLVDVTWMYILLIPRIQMPSVLLPSFAAIQLVADWLVYMSALTACPTGSCTFLALRTFLPCQEAALHWEVCLAHPQVWITFADWTGNWLMVLGEDDCLAWWVIMLINSHCP